MIASALSRKMMNKSKCLIRNVLLVLQINMENGFIREAFKRYPLTRQVKQLLIIII